ncbi:SEC-C metal-binding domain-containing protein [Almyronema epifaneia]|uniref:SEC-C metal-binding domain-containing protein n=1 Tax=Almyronema epifaneia S1 TaxID=2991925 RepID=A0ABW6IDC4_9CYAN
MLAAHSDLDHTLKWLQAQPQGTLLCEPSGVHLVQVIKRGSRIQLVLLDQSSLSSQLLQSEWDLEQPFQLTAVSTQALLLGLVGVPQPRRIYLAGLGGGRLAFVLHRSLPTVTLECAEIEPLLLQVSQQFFGLRPDERLRLHLADGRAYLTAATDAYDLILVNVALGNGYTPYALATADFYQLCQRRLSAAGAIAVNLPALDPYLADKVYTFSQVFSQSYVCALANGNTILLGFQTDERSLSELQAQAQQLSQVYPFAPAIEPLAATLQTSHTWLCSFAHPPHLLTDKTPPHGYFDRLPRFNTLFAQVASDQPCPCGSGRRFESCHGSFGDYE